jgi:hypothetical protein
MGVVVNKSFDQIRKRIGSKSNKILVCLERYPTEIGLQGYDLAKWSKKQNDVYDRLCSLCYDLVEEISSLDEVDVPGFRK